MWLTHLNDASDDQNPQKSEQTREQGTVQHDLYPAICQYMSLPGPPSAEVVLALHSVRCKREEHCSSDQQRFED